MINNVIEAVCEALVKEFGEGYSYYTEAVKQGLKEPCFFINLLSPTNELSLGNRYLRTNKLLIQYFPKGQEKNAECYSAAERLFRCLELITYAKKLTRGAGMQIEIVEGILNFKVNYDFFVQKSVIAEDPMSELLQNNTKVKG